jgi:hypothetical protein
MAVRGMCTGFSPRRQGCAKGGMGAKPCRDASSEDEDVSVP